MDLPFFANFHGLQCLGKSELIMSNLIDLFLKKDFK